MSATLATIAAILLALLKAIPALSQLVHDGLNERARAREAEAAKHRQAKDAAVDAALPPLPAMKKLLLILAALALSGCASVKLDNSARLMSRPDFAAARTAAPEWARDALKTINALEYELERR
jgi:hypothetical protein